jgi:hypothetical protein
VASRHRIHNRKLSYAGEGRCRSIVFF